MASASKSQFANDTQFYARLLGAYMVPMGIGLIVSNKYYATVFKQLSSDDDTVAASPATISWAFVSTGLGVTIISNHNRWNTLPEKVVSFAGWASLLKGILFAAVPQTFNSRFKALHKEEHLKYAGMFAVAFGAYLLKIGFEKAPSNA
mmetsp:Transcript_74536/g.118654  ORF Transcript_74536/g.118654 Transcript_74536/m.118654 type:complete len:148 (+) Transcript_74536:24-467(+)